MTIRTFFKGKNLVGESTCGGGGGVPGGGKLSKFEKPRFILILKTLSYCSTFKMNC